MKMKKIVQLLIVGLISLPLLSRGQNDFVMLFQQAESGDVGAQCNLGYAYAKGLGVQRSYVQAVYWWKKAAMKGDADAKYNLAVAYEFGNGVPQDRVKAAKSYRSAAQKGHARAQWRLSVVFSDGKWCRPNPSTAARWASRALKSGYTGNLKQGESSGSSSSGLDFTPSSYNSAKFPIESYNIDAITKTGVLVVNLSKTGGGEEKMRIKMFEWIEKARSSANIGLVTGKAAPKGAKYRVTSESIAGKLFTIKFEWF